jgi:hypothetical protein
MSHNASAGHQARWKWRQQSVNQANITFVALADRGPPRLSRPVSHDEGVSSVLLAVEAPRAQVQALTPEAASATREAHMHVDIDVRQCRATVHAPRHGSGGH